LPFEKHSEPATVSPISHAQSENQSQTHPLAQDRHANPLIAYLKRTLVLLLALAALVYVLDYARVRLRVAFPKLGPALDSVQMDRLYAIALKNGRTEYELDAQQPEVTVTCVRSLFPHLGYNPCWYLRRNSQKPIPMVILISARP
jgi:hypothetical protein